MMRPRPATGTETGTVAGTATATSSEQVFVVDRRLVNLPAVREQRGTDPAFVRQELDYAIDRHIASHPRSRQKRIGPSEIGHPCGRRLAYKLAGVEQVNTSAASWKQEVGTAVHAVLKEAMDAENLATGTRRYLTEVRVNVGEVDGQAITGNCDLADLMTAGAIDFKVSGVASLRAMKANGPSQQYRTQVHLYGRGLQRAGAPIDWVGIYMLPQNGERHEAVWWTEPYQEQIALAALARVETITALVKVAGPMAATALPPVDAFCAWCPWHLPASTELAEACPGFDSKAVGR